MEGQHEFGISVERDPRPNVADAEFALAVLGDVGDSYLPVFDGVGLVAESGVGAS